MKVKLRRRKWSMPITFMKNPVTLSVSKSALDSFQKITGNLKTYDGTKLGLILDAIYQQGVQDGAQQVIRQMEETVQKAQKQLPLTTTSRKIRKKISL